MIADFNGTKYAYILNLQGDVVGIKNIAGTEVVRYTYDAWGKKLSTTGTMAATLGYLNPFRYRGYVYESETGKGFHTDTSKETYEVRVHAQLYAAGIFTSHTDITDVSTYEGKGWFPAIHLQ